jgi:hypothetical protein
VALQRKNEELAQQSNELARRSEELAVLAACALYLPKY